MSCILKQIIRAGILTEPPPSPVPEWQIIIKPLHESILKAFGRAASIRHVDAGSCNGCELEIHALHNPYYNIEGLGIRFVAGPRHADLLLVTGPVTLNMKEAVRRAYSTAPHPDPGVAICAGACDRCVL